MLKEEQMLTICPIKIETISPFSLDLFTYYLEVFTKSQMSEQNLRWVNDYFLLSLQTCMLPTESRKKVFMYGKGKTHKLGGVQVIMRLVFFIDLWNLSISNFAKLSRTISEFFRSSQISPLE